MTPLQISVAGLVAAGLLTLVAAPADARYRGTQPVCVSGVASNDRLNVRSGPGPSFRRLGSFGPFQCGMNVEAVEGNWTYLRGSDRGRNLEGWVYNRYLVRAGGGNPGRSQCVVNVAFNDVLNIRSRRSGSAPIVGIIPPGECGVRILGQRGSWKRVRYNGVTGWSAARFLR